MKIFSESLSIASLVCCLFAAMPESSHAEVEVLGYWKLSGPSGQTGEVDIAEDVIKGKPGSGELLISGNPQYSSDAPDSGVTTGSIKFNIGDYLYLDKPVTNLVDRFGIEIWVKSDEPVGGKGISILKNGSGRPGFGYGIQQSPENTYVGIFDGVTHIQNLVDEIPVTGEWTHLALVRDAATFGTQLYANGRLIYSSEKRTPVPKSPDEKGGAFIIGGTNVDNGVMRGSFSGNIALVRVFKFERGEFDPTDLLIGKK